MTIDPQVLLSRHLRCARGTALAKREVPSSCSTSITWTSVVLGQSVRRGPCHMTIVPTASYLRVECFAIANVR